MLTWFWVCCTERPLADMIALLVVVIDASVTGRSSLLSHLIQRSQLLKSCRLSAYLSRNLPAIRLQAGTQWKPKPPGRGKEEENKHVTASTSSCNGVWGSCFVTVTGSKSPTVVLHLSCILQVSSFHHTLSCNAFLVSGLLSWWFVDICFLERRCNSVMSAVHAVCISVPPM